MTNNPPHLDKVIGNYHVKTENEEVHPDSIGGAFIFDIEFKRVRDFGLYKRKPKIFKWNNKELIDVIEKDKIVLKTKLYVSSYGVLANNITNKSHLLSLEKDTLPEVRLELEKTIQIVCKDYVKLYKGKTTSYRDFIMPGDGRI